MTAAAPVTRQHGNSYEIFILVLTVLSLVVMGSLLLPLDQATLDTLFFWDNFICVIFLIDFAYEISGSHPRSEYFLRKRGWLDLLGSIPSLGILRITALLRLFRLSRLARVIRLLGGQNRTALIHDVVRNRSQYALFLTVLLAVMVMTVCSVLVLQFEGRSPDSNIKTGGDALWWALVTITTVGYGDFFPVTTLGRFVGAFVMLSGVGIIGALASILSSLLLSPTPEESEQAAIRPRRQPRPLRLTQVVAFRPSLRRRAPSLARTRESLDQTRGEMAEISQCSKGRCRRTRQTRAEEPRADRSRAHAASNDVARIETAGPMGPASDATQ
jgi:voltage-gated potassium channel